MNNYVGGYNGVGTKHWHNGWFLIELVNQPITACNSVFAIENSICGGGIH